MSIIEAKNITKIFGSGHTAVKAINGVSLKVEAGDIILIMGPSGSGKTTLISMLGTLMRPTGGTIWIGGEDISEMSGAKLANLRLHHLGFMFQSFNLLSALTAQQNAAVPLMIAGLSKKPALKKAEELLEKLQLGERLDSLPKNLSGGEKQRVAVARALANQPAVILADEPTANLDSKTGHEVMQLLCNTACSEGRAVIIVSHDARLKDVAKRVITIEDGRLTKEEPGNHEPNCPTEHGGQKQ
ncbi:ABC transporter ATP-binding protein [Candidatus Saccharibacteria bacterium]|nr:ABC transporter ATP-binding protein [Candidatus Saccharibacteria bacterium]